MNITIIGTGYVGLVSGVCLAEIGSNVLCMDTDEEKINKLKNGESTIYEPDLENILKKNLLHTHRLNFTTDLKKAVDFGQIIFVTVGTPQQLDDSADLRYIFQAAREIAYSLDEYKIIAIKSTVPVGTGNKVRDEINEILKKRNRYIDFDVVSNPEFLREGSAVSDFINTDRIVIGAQSEKAFNIMKEMYNIHNLLGVPIITTNIETAELIKYASNTFLASKISFINEIANMCEHCGADVTVISKAMGLDKRIGSKFLNPGPGYGGSCFPKDTKAMVSIGKAIGYVPKIVKAAININDKQKILMVRKIKKAVRKMKGKTITILGVAFKPDTDDIRESPSIEIIQALLNSGAHIKVYDPKAMANTKKYYPQFNIEYCSELYSACKDSSAIVVATEWKEFESLNFEKVKKDAKSPVIIDLRNIFDPEQVKGYGFKYYGVGRK